MQTPRFSLPYISAQQSRKEDFHNKALSIIDTFLYLAVIGVNINTPPANAQSGGAYIVSTAPTGLWTGRGQNIAIWLNDRWQYFSPCAGMYAWSSADSFFVQYDGSNWQQTAILSINGGQAVVDSIGLGMVADDNNRLAVSGSSVLFTAKKVQYGGDGNIQIKINKQDEQNTASVMFKTNSVAKVELGCNGNNDFTFKTYNNGSVQEAIKILSGSSRLTFKSLAYGLTATGSNSSTAKLIEYQMNEFTTVANGTGARLPPAEAGSLIFICNGGVSDLKVYPSTNDKVAVYDTSNIFLLKSKKTAICWTAGDELWFINASSNYPQ